MWKSGDSLDQSKWNHYISKANIASSKWFKILTVTKSSLKITRYYRGKNSYNQSKNSKDAKDDYLPLVEMLPRGQYDGLLVTSFHSLTKVVSFSVSFQENQSTFFFFFSFFLVRANSPKWQLTSLRHRFPLGKYVFTRLSPACSIHVGKYP